MSRIDPTGTATIRHGYAVALRAPLGKIATQARYDIVERDVFGLETNANGSGPGPTPGALFAASRDPDAGPNLVGKSSREQVRRLEEWVRDQMTRGTRPVTERGEYIEDAYLRGLKDADADLRKSSVDPSDLNMADPDDAIRTGRHRRTLSGLIERSKKEVSEVVEKTAEAVGEAAADALGVVGEAVDTLTPDALAAAVTDRIDKVGRTGMTRTATTEAVRAHADASIERFEETVNAIDPEAEALLGPQIENLTEAEQAAITKAAMDDAGKSLTVYDNLKDAKEAKKADALREIHVFETAGDDRVCPQCMALGGDTFKTYDASGLIPVHPGCRCRWRFYGYIDNNGNFIETSAISRELGSAA